MKLGETQAIKIAQEWLKQDLGEVLPLIGAFYMPEAKGGGNEGYYSDQPARWLVSFQCNTAEGYEPDHTDLYIDVETGEVYAPRMM